MCRASRGIEIPALTITALLMSAPLMAQPAPVTFTRDVAPLLAARCTACHHEGGLAPFSLVTFDDVAPRAAEIVRAAETRRMPPWKPEPGFGGPFVAEKRLSDEEIALLRRWVEAGAPPGDAHAHEGMHAAAGWRLGTPDLVVSLPEPYQLPAGRNDVFRNFAVPLPVARGHFVRGIEFLPDNPHVTHHANMRIDPTGNSRRLDAHDPEPGYEGITASTAVYPDGYFLGWTPGQAAPLLPDGFAWRLTPASTLVVEMHLVPSPTPSPVSFKVGLYFTEVPPSNAPVMLRLGKQDIDIPAGQTRYVVRDRYTLPVAVDVLSLQPHAHFLARDVSAFATLPDGQRRWLLRIRDWDFHTQDLYRYRTPVPLPAGSTIHMEYTYDNSAGNPANRARPPGRVRWGQYTSDEMGDLWVQVRPSAGGNAASLIQTIRAKELAEDIVGYEGLLKRYPDDVRILASLADALDRSGRRKEALAALREHVRREPSSAQAHYNLGVMLVSIDSLPEAEAQFESAVLLDPASVAALNALGAVVLDRGNDPRQAIPRFKAAIALDASYAKAHNNLGIAYTRLGLFREARDAHEAAVALAPDDPSARYNLAGLLAATGAFELALRHAQAAFDLAPRDPAVAERLDLLLQAVGASARPQVSQ